MRDTVYTIGHSTRSVAELVAMLRAHGVVTLADIRSTRRSRTNPQFDEATLPAALAKAGLAYVALPALGGRRPKPQRPPRLANDAWDRSGAYHTGFRNYADYALAPAFREGLAQLLALPGPVAIMCAEAVWWRCHRRIVSDHLIARRVPVVHIMTEHAAVPATLTPFAVIVRGRVHYPRLAAGGARRSAGA